MGATGEVDRRRALGAFYTPPDVVDAALDLALDPLLAVRAAAGVDAVRALRAIDPACGTGNFLVPVAARLIEALASLGVPAAEAASHVVGQAVVGIDIDPAALDGARAALQELARTHGAPGVVPRLVLADGLAEHPAAPEGGFDLVVGNPPFLGQLRSDTARAAGAADALRARFGSAVAAYTDPAWLFLVLGARLARPDGGRVAMVQPMSGLSARDAAGAREAVLARGTLTDLWVLDERVFDADVEVCVPVLERAGIGEGDGGVAEGRGSVRLWRGRSPLAAGTGVRPMGGEAWSPLLAALDDVPHRTLATSGTLADLATASADFRDQYYGLAPHVVDDPDAVGMPPLVTVGLLDPAHLAWGERPTRLHKVVRHHPRVDVAALPEPLAAWAERRLVPKVLLATQTKVPEVVVDAAGALLPSVPVVTVMAEPEDLWRVAAVLTAPAVAAEAARRHLGSGRSAGALRLRPADVLALPLPAHRDPWDRAATAFAAAQAVDQSDPGAADERRALLLEVGRAMGDAYGVGGDEELLAWWAARLPAAARGTRAVHR